MSIYFKIHGAGRYVGESCMEVVFPQGERCLLDIGNPQADIEALDYLDAVFLTHPHTDHFLGLADQYERGLRAPVFVPHPVCSRIVWELYHDWFNIKVRKGEWPIIGGEETLLRSCQLLMAKKSGQFGMVLFRFLPNAHIPGSGVIHLDDRYGNSVLYTGDISFRESRLLAPCGSLPENVKVLIADCTNAGRTVPPRQEVESKFKEHVRKVIRRGGRVLVAAFSQARAQEIMIILAELMHELRQEFPELHVPLYQDGLTQRITDAYLMYRNLLKDQALHNANLMFERVRSQKHRRTISFRSGIFLASGGMMPDTPALRTYLEAMAFNPKDSLCIVGYQVQGTRGRKLLDTGHLNINGVETMIRCEVSQFDFSAHCDSDDLAFLLAQVKPRFMVAQHGDDEAIAAACQIAQQAGVEVTAPRNGESFEL